MDISEPPQNVAGLPVGAPSAASIEYYRHLSSVVMFNPRGPRFVAAKLLVLKERGSLLILTALTVFLIAISIVLLGTPEAVDARSTRQIGVLSAIASVAVLAISLFDYTLGRALAGSRLHESAVKITKIMREIERELERPSPSIARLERSARKYEAIIAATDVNHSSIDSVLFSMSRWKSNCWLANLVYRSCSFVAQLLVIAFTLLPGLLALSAVLFYAQRLLAIHG